MRCGRCGNENSENNRFCGMCGAILVPKAQAPGVTVPAGTRASEESRVPARSANEAVPVTPPISNAPIVAPTQAAPPRVDSSPAVYGPSFLGLNRPSDGGSGDGLRSGSAGDLDPLRRGSGNLDYLLEDEEEPRRGWGKLFLVVIALGLIGGFGYLRWQQGGFNFLKLTPTVQPSQNAPDTGSTPGTTASPDTAGPNAASPNSANPSPANSNSAVPNSASPSTTTPAPATPDVAASGGAAGANGTAANGAETGTQPPASANTTPAASAAPDNSPPAKPQDSAAAEKSPGSDSGDDAAAEPSKPEARAPAASAKPSATRARERKPSPVTAADPTAEAERYIYGRSVPQDCDRGLRLLKPAAQTNPKAMIALGTLYSSGTCTPRDLPTAYRWFAMALHKQPDNSRLQDDLQKLWSQMTPPERQLAIKLSQ